MKISGLYLLGSEYWQVVRFSVNSGSVKVKNVFIS